MSYIPRHIREARQKEDGSTMNASQFPPLAVVPNTRVGWAPATSFAQIMRQHVVKEEQEQQEEARQNRLRMADLADAQRDSSSLHTVQLSRLRLKNIERNRERELRSRFDEYASQEDYSPHSPPYPQCDVGQEFDRQPTVSNAIFDTGKDNNGWTMVNRARKATGRETDAGSSRTESHSEQKDAEMPDSVIPAPIGRGDPHSLY